ncbi:hypothetical protein ACFWBC_08070 [Streptomyces sp. NPDC059985]|uniref:hypothetical protein n=1 Tax=Streptomyces sp. NPDC059985 TaxID=3347025 RepID=UPI0036A47A7D
MIDVPDTDPDEDPDPDPAPDPDPDPDPHDGSLPPFSIHHQGNPPLAAHCFDPALSH